MDIKTLYILVISILLGACSRQQQSTDEQIAANCLDEAEVSGDWHTKYIAYQRQAEMLSQGNPEEALRLMMKALAIYEQHPDDEHNYVILLDYAGTYAAQVAYINEGSYDEALDYVNRAYDIAKHRQMPDMMCQTLTSLANIAWAREDYRQAVNYAREADSLATDDLRPGALQVLARSYLSLNMLDSAETAYRQIEPGTDVHLAYIVQSNLAIIALRRMGATQLEDDIDEAFEQIESFYFKAMEQKDQYYQQSLRQEKENQQLDYRSRLYRRTLLIVIIAAVIILVAVVMALRYRIRMLRQQRAFEQSKLEKANEVVTFLQNFILERTEVMQKLNQSGDALITLKPHEWTEIERTLNAIDSNRFARIRELYPNMQEDDIRLCILTRLGISNRAIGNIYCITISAVQHRKLKLKKDVFGESNPDVTLEQILKRIES
ncbi:MAG: tetratricopeptide repeat protein [Prevotella sp.]|nr:tetratricopeptide repeat protein [Prevotella sp.]